MRARILLCVEVVIWIWGIPRVVREYFAERCLDSVAIPAWSLDVTGARFNRTWHFHCLLVVYDAAP